ncbi:MAG: glycoside hydrolase family 15 protein [Pyrinomonadaceae bacterium]
MKKMRLANASVRCVLFVFVLCGALRAQTASNLAPGRDAQWLSAGKDGVGTSNTLDSRVWFTLREGIMTEVYYPTVDVANVQELQFFVLAPDKFESESESTIHRIEVLDPRALSFRQINTAKSGEYTITKTYTTDPERHTVLIDVQFKSRKPGTPYALLLRYDPSLNNSGMHDSAWTQGDALLAADADKASALISSTGFIEATNEYYGSGSMLNFMSHPWSGLFSHKYVRAVDGNVVQLAQVRHNRPFTLALAFGKEPDEALKNARASLAKGFARCRAEYEKGWHDYVGTLRRVAVKYQAQFDMAAMVLRAHEDKTYRGAQIASLTVPWGGGANANEPNVGGYHLVWSRDLYQVATALYALGDKAGADRALDYLFRVQQKADGSFPQNSWLDGRPFWGSLQLDEVAYPLILAYQLGRTDNETWTKHVKPAADFLVKTGPRTPQERWEEKPGYSPATIAAEIAGLVCAAEIARRNDAQAAAAIYLATADDWQRNVERWTATVTGKHGDGNYYLRITENDNPNDGQMMNAGNGGGDHDEREYVDAGFLELVRLGLKRADDPLIVKSLAVIDQVIKVETPNGPLWYRYNHDGYGEMDDGRPWNFDGHYTGKGRLWALLAGERGEYELARGDRAAAEARLGHMLGFANEGLMLPEQVWDRQTGPFKFGEGTGSATPLAWTMGQFIRLAVNLDEGRNIETPDLVAARYVQQAPPLHADVSEAAFPDEEVLRHMEAGTSFKVRGPVGRGVHLYALVGNEARELTLGATGVAELDVPVPAGESTVVAAVTTTDGATGVRRLSVRGLTKDELRADEIQMAALPIETERFKQIDHAPLVKDDEVTFIYRGAAKRVEVVGDFTSWAPRGLVLRELPGTNVKYLTRKFGRAARVEYKLIVDGEWMGDPLNPQKLDNGVGGFNNYFTMPGYRPAALATDRDDLRGKLEAVEVPTRLLDGGRRKLQVYLPPDYDRAGARFPVLYLQDGSDYVKRARAAVIADQLITQGRIAPFIIIFIDPVDRTREYWLNDRFAEFMATELVPFIDARYRTRATRDARALLGASLGGVISYWTALKYPDTFARIGGQSSAFQIDNDREVAALAALPASNAHRPMKFYLDVGLLEPIWEVNRRARVLLAGKGYSVVYHENEAGHNWTSWRDQLADAYRALWRD